jgi:predicted metal-binding membrane protein
MGKVFRFSVKWKNRVWPLASVACCWGLMLILIAVGVMNIPAIDHYALNILEGRSIGSSIEWTRD